MLMYFKSRFPERECERDYPCAGSRLGSSQWPVLNQTNTRSVDSAPTQSVYTEFSLCITLFYWIVAVTFSPISFNSFTLLVKCRTCPSLLPALYFYHTYRISLSAYVYVSIYILSLPCFFHWRRFCVLLDYQNQAWCSAALHMIGSVSSSWRNRWLWLYGLDPWLALNSGSRVQRPWITKIVGRMKVYGN